MNIYTTTSLSIYTLMETCFGVLPIVNNAAMTVGVQIFFQSAFLFPLDVIPEMQLFNYMVVLV